MPTRIICLLALFCLLSACGAPQRDDSTESERTRDRIESLLADAEQAPAPERQRLQLQAAQLLLESRELDAAANTLQAVDTAELAADGRAWLIQLQAALDLARRRPENALARLNNAELAQLGDQLSGPRQLALSQLRARALALNGDHFASAQERIFMAPMLAPAARGDNRDAIWQSLMYLDPVQLRQFREQALSNDLRAWLELALVARDTRLGLQAQADALSYWLEQWPEHPAARDLPENLRLIRELAGRQPQQVALLLPLSGRLQTFGRAVRDGFMAAWYEQPEPRARVRTYDTAASDDTLALYRHAVAEGAELVIGPLDKQRVGDLHQQTELPVPVLALNRSGLELTAPEALYQFSLAPEDEARLLAESAAQHLYERALVLTPGDDNSRRVLQTFGERWRSLGGSVVKSALVDDPQAYSDQVAQALNLHLSRDRAIGIERLIGRDVEFTPRRRRDVDFVLLLTQPQAARSIKPLLAYHYAGSVPVYATSRIYEGHPQPGRDRDLDGVIFTDIPWLLDDTAPLRDAILSTYPRQRSYLRLYALGIDSVRLYPRLEQLAQLPESGLHGRTGYLTLNSRREIERELSLARFRNGRPQRLSMPDRTLDFDAGMDASDGTIPQ